jgi:hypothetical protein
VPRAMAEQFAKCFAPGVIRVDPKTKAVSVDAEACRRETVTREVFRYPEFEDCCKLARVRDYFLCACLSCLSVLDADVGMQSTSKAKVRMRPSGSSGRV